MTNDECVTANGRVNAAETRGMVLGAKLLLMATYNMNSDERGNVDNDPSIADFLREVNPLVDAGYVAEKCATWRKSPTVLIASLDRERLAKFICWCDARWGEECRARIGRID